jgi:hypothetical protein
VTNIAAWSTESCNLRQMLRTALWLKGVGRMMTMFAVHETAEAQVEVWAILASDEFAFWHF